MLLACSNGADDDALVVPERLSVTALAGGNGVLDVIALTLRAGAHNSEIYAALLDVGDRPACSAAVFSGESRRAPARRRDRQRHSRHRARRWLDVRDRHCGCARN
jgi:hypothetical protein